MTPTRRSTIEEEWARVTSQITELHGGVKSLAEITADLEASHIGDDHRPAALERALAELAQVQREIEEILHLRGAGPIQQQAETKSESREPSPAQNSVEDPRLAHLSQQIGDLAGTVAGTKYRLDAYHEWLQRLDALVSYTRDRTEMLWSSKPWRAYLRLGRFSRSLDSEVPTPAPIASNLPAAEVPASAPPASAPPVAVASPNVGVFLPYKAESDAYLVPSSLARAQISKRDGLPLPPGPLMLGHANEHEFISWGEDHVGNMRRLLGESGYLFQEGDRVLDFGCGSGRMLRHFHPLASKSEFWGVDIRSEHILWCKQYLSPPFHFAVTTTLPHLPFEDRHFDLIYAGSVFTHIDDLADSWFLELRRVLKPGGTLYFTIHDHHSMEVLLNAPSDSLAMQVLTAHSDFEEYSRSDYSMFTLWRSVDSQVFYDLGYLHDRLEQIFDVISHSEEAYGFQTAIIVRKPETFASTES